MSAISRGLTGASTVMVAPIAVANGTATCTALDCSRGYGCTVEVTVGVTTGNFSVFKLQSSATSGGTYADITGATMTGPGATDDGGIWAFHVDMRDRNIGPFIKLVMTEDNTGSGLVNVTGRVWNLDEGGASATARGYTAEVFV